MKIFSILSIFFYLLFGNFFCLGILHKKGGLFLCKKTYRVLSFFINIVFCIYKNNFI